MSVNVTFDHVGKYAFGKVEVDGVDISNHVMSLVFERTQDGAAVLTLRLAIHGEDKIDLGSIPPENVQVHEHLYRIERGKDAVITAA